MPPSDRIPESTVVAGACADARAGASRLVGVVGSPRSGRSAVLRAAALRARTAGLLVLYGRTAEHERHVPFGLLVDALDPTIARLGRDRVAAAGPALGAALPSAAGGERLDLAGPAERHRHHRAVGALLELLGRDRPVALLLDDVHRADAASIEALESLLRHPPRSSFLMVLTMERSDVATRLLAAGRRSAAWDEVELAASKGDEPSAPSDTPLDPAARALLEGAAVAGDPFSLEIAAAAAGLGRPDGAAALDALVAARLVRTGERRGTFRLRDALLRRAVLEAIAPDVRAAAHERAAYALLAIGARPPAVAHHVEQFGRPEDPGAIALLTAAAEACTDTSPAAAAHWYSAALRLLPEADPAARARLLIPMTHALLATGRADEAGGTLATGRADEAVEAVAAGGPGEALATTRASMGADAAAMLAAEQAVAFALRSDVADEADAPWAAGAQLARAERYAEAVEMLGRGIRQVRADRADHLLLPFHALIARSALPLLELDTALEHAEAAEAIARLQGLTRERALALSVLAQVLVARAEPATARAAAAESDELLATLPSDTATRTALAHNATISLADAPERLLAELTALGGPRLEALDPAATAGLLLTATRAALAVGRVDDAARYAEATIGSADGPQRPASAVRGVRARAEVLLARGDARAAAWLAASAVSDAHRLSLREEELGAQQLSDRALLARRGDYTTAATRRAGSSDGAHAIGEDRARQASRGTGDAGSPGPPGGASPAGDDRRAHPAGSASDARRAGLFEDESSTGDEHHRRPADGAGDTRRSDGESRAADDHRAPRTDADPRRTSLPDDTTLAGGARGSRRVDSAGATDDTRHPHPSGDARGASRANGTGDDDASRAGTSADARGASRASGTGATDAARLTRSAGDTGRLGRARPTNNDNNTSRAAPALSARERSVAELVAEGCSNKEVAARLFLSEKTVEANLTRIYEKVGVRSRTELARASGWR